MESFTREEKHYALRRGTYVDFLLFRTVDKSSVLAIEVDGHENHKKGTKQYEVNDKLKDSIFKKANLQLIRFPKTGSNEEMKLRSTLELFR